MISSQNHICYDERCTAAFKFYFDEHGILLKGKIIMLAPDTESVYNSSSIMLQKPEIMLFWDVLMAESTKK